MAIRKTASDLNGATAAAMRASKHVYRSVGQPYCMHSLKADKQAYIRFLCTLNFQSLHFSTHPMGFWGFGVLGFWG